MKTVAVTGASGCVGRRLVARLRSDGCRVVALVRRAPAAADEQRWDPDGGTVDWGGVTPDAVVHLAGEGIGARRWNLEHKSRVLTSRVRGTHVLSTAIAALQPRPATFVCASAVGYYGDRGDEVLTESSAPGHGFLADLCVAWERACDPARDAGITVVNTRIGLVLGARPGGLLSRLIPMFRFGLGGRLGSGRQYMSWISSADATQALVRAVTGALPAGPVNLTSPNAVTNAEFTRALARAVRRPVSVPAPALLLRRVLGREMAQEMLLGGQRVQPSRLLEAGFTFTHPDVTSALEAAVSGADDQPSSSS